ncbi:MAG TPA: ECF-type sigma factor, partial [Phycisphaerae bacterium]
MGATPPVATRIRFQELRMATTAPGTVTQLLAEYGEGDPAALNRILPLVYDELRELADRALRSERRDHTLQTTALVHEAYLRLVDQNRVHWRNRAHFFGIAAQMMRRILVDHARGQQADKRGRGEPQVALDEACIAASQRGLDLIALDEALTRLSAIDPQQGRIVEL